MTDKYHHGDLKNILLEKGIELINEGGIDNVSMRKLATECKVSHQAPYNHFKSKDDFIMQVKQYALDEFAEVLEEGLEEIKDDHEMIIEIGIRYVEFFTEHKPYYKIVMEMADWRIDIEEDKIKAENCKPFQIFKETAEKFLCRYNMTDKAVAQTIITMWAMVEGLTSMSTIKGIKFNVNIRKYVREILLNSGRNCE